MQDKIFFSSCFGFLLGVFLSSFVFVNLYFLIIFALLGLFVFLFVRNKWSVVSFVFIFLFCLGVFYFQLADKSPNKIFEKEVGIKSTFSGVLVDEPNIGEFNQKLVVEVEKRADNKTLVLLSANLGEYYKYGDEINFKGVLERPENFTTEQGKIFDYVNYLRKDGIFYVVKYPDIEIISSGNGNIVRSFLFSFKEKFLNKMNFAIGGNEALLMGGLILGEKSTFSSELRKDFVNTGTIHIVALSGYNVTIVAEWIMKIFSGLPKNIGISFGIFSIILFVLMTGASSTAVRAGIMAALALFARLIGRNYDVLRALLLAGVMMILINPFVLVFDVSFQLSFIATFAVIFFTPKIEKYFMWITPRLGLRDIVSVTVACYIFVLPFILYKMGNLSLVALPANILILPFIPFTMILGFLTGLSGLIFYALSVPFGFASYLFLHYELFIVKFFADFSFASLTIPNFPLLFVIMIYAYFVYKLFGEDIKNFFRAIY